MNTTAQDLATKSHNWLKNSVFPLWSKNGIDLQTGAFAEGLSLEGRGLTSPRRALVQARQIYSFVTAGRLDIVDQDVVKKTITQAITNFSKLYLLENGACLHSVTPEGVPHNKDLDLYTQAFALFAYANAFEVTKDEKHKTEALKILSYLKRERKAKGGGYTEIKDGKVFYQSNPHMHLFESALAWATVDAGEEWKDLSDELYELCMTKFIDQETGNLCEHFEEGWIPQRTEGNFIFEPGHHFEWAWLLSIYQDFFSIDCRPTALSLYEKATKLGVNAKNFTVDEVWSNGVVKKSSSRFWPQCERIKAAARLGLDAPIREQKNFAQQADEAMTVLFTYLDTPIKGAWQDVLLESGEFSKQDPKGSSLYHIINAMDEYLNFRPKLIE